MNSKMSPLMMAARDGLICLAISGIVVLSDHDAWSNPLRRAILVSVVVGVPLINYLLNHRRAARAAS